MNFSKKSVWGIKPLDLPPSQFTELKWSLTYVSRGNYGVNDSPVSRGDFGANGCGLMKCASRDVVVVLTEGAAEEERSSTNSSSGEIFAFSGSRLILLKLCQELPQLPELLQKITQWRNP